MTKKTSMEETSDEDLFIYIACAETPADKVMADAAIAEIHRRYIKGLYARCERMLRAHPGGDVLAEDLAAVTVAQAYDRAHTFRPDPEGKSGSSRTLAWLCKIAQNCFRDYLRNPRRPSPLNVVELDVNAEQYAPQDFAALHLEDESSSYSAHHHQLVAEAFDTLDDRTKIVLIETLVQKSRSRSKTYMLKGSAAELADRIGTTTANLRRIRMKGIQKINTHVEKNKKTETKND